MLNKSSFTYEWCTSSDICIGLIPFPKNINFKKKLGNKYYYKISTANKRYRCPTCNRQLTLFIRECDDPGCFHIYLPKHKARKKIPQTSKNRYTNYRVLRRSPR